jgi:hypothetical protein
VTTTSGASGVIDAHTAPDGSGPVHANSSRTASGVIDTRSAPNGSGPVQASAASPAAAATYEPARSIQEAIERLVDDLETDEAVAEWTQGRA